MPLRVFSTASTATSATPDTVVECSGQRTPLASASGTFHTPPALSSGQNNSPPAHTKNLQVPRVSITRSKHIHLAHTLSTRRAVLTRAVIADANVKERVPTPCDAPKGAPVAFTTASARWKRLLRLPCDPNVNVPASRTAFAPALPLRRQFRARFCAHAMRSLRARSHAMRTMTAPPALLRAMRT
ncbi:hypothetical protein B0H19DRAFT_1247693 [Mycena capillaripes]|nr:hypothetical protein B0H19DRAFT_1247693 [Mycena capillaripes]